MLLFWLAWLSALWPSALLVTAQDNDDNGVDDLPDDQVDQWDTVPLSLPLDENLEADSDQLLKAELSEIRQESEAEIQAYNQLHAESPGNQASLVDDEDFRLDWFKQVIKAQDYPQAEAEIVIFNTDDFDSESDDVDGDSPFAPPI